VLLGTGKLIFVQVNIGDEAVAGEAMILGGEGAMVLEGIGKGRRRRIFSTWGNTWTRRSALNLLADERVCFFPPKGKRTSRAA
jgi:hypothetical protein